MSPSSEDHLKERICPNCHMGIMEPHQELDNWVKCRICGCCSEIKKEKKDGTKV